MNRPAIVLRTPHADWMSGIEKRVGVFANGLSDLWIPSVLVERRQVEHQSLLMPRARIERCVITDHLGPSPGLGALSCWPEPRLFPMPRLQNFRCARFACQVAPVFAPVFEHIVEALVAG